MNGKNVDGKNLYITAAKPKKGEFLLHKYLTHALQIVLPIKTKSLLRHQLQYWMFLMERKKVSHNRYKFIILTYSQQTTPRKKTGELKEVRISIAHSDLIILQLGKAVTIHYIKRNYLNCMKLT